MDTDELRVSTTELIGTRLDGLRSTGMLIATAGAILTIAAGTSVLVFARYCPTARLSLPRTPSREHVSSLETMTTKA